MRETKYLKVETSHAGYDSGHVVFGAKYKDKTLHTHSDFTHTYKNLTLRDSDFKDAEDLIAEGRDEFRQTLVKIYDMPPCDRVKVFGTGTVGDIVRKTDFTAMREKLEEYENTPKVGEIWETNETKRKVIVINTDGEAVEYWCILSRMYGVTEIPDFRRSYHKTDKTSKALMPFLKELEGLENE